MQNTNDNAEHEITEHLPLWKVNQRVVSQFIRVIPAPDYADYIAACAQQGHGGRDFDSQGRRIA